jgi:hypothetical protein
MGLEALSVNESRETGMKQHLAKKERKNIYQLKKKESIFSTLHAMLSQIRIRKTFWLRTISN